ncbi:MAG: tRNA dihydrouridine synthase [Lachnospiraceae bacterium]
MKYYFAPMEGIGRYIYRNAYHAYFYPMDKYFTPFLSPNQNKTLKTRDMQDALPENNSSGYIVPQILTSHAEDFIEMARRLEQLGYGEVNLNLGCPSPTVVTKGKGAGFLARPEELDRFLDRIFQGLEMKISVKTRLGKENPEEFRKLLDIYNRYPLEELIVHPRMLTDYYNNKPNYDMFEVALRESENPLCYNGDIFTAADFETLKLRFPENDTIMLGRGILRNPMLPEELTGVKQQDKIRLRKFHDAIYHKYNEILPGGHTVLFKMKEIWFHMIDLFEDASVYGKKIKKAQKPDGYERIIDRLFEEKNLISDRR